MTMLLDGSIDGLGDSIDEVDWMGRDGPEIRILLEFALLIYMLLYVSLSSHNLNNGRFISMMKKMPEKKNELREAFKTFDADGDGSTTRSELRRILIKFGQHLSDQELDAVMAEVDQNRGESILCHWICFISSYLCEDWPHTNLTAKFIAAYFFSHIRWSHFL